MTPPHQMTTAVGLFPLHDVAPESIVMAGLYLGLAGHGGLATYTAALLDQQEVG
jgi:hypothetical protein